MADTYYLPGEVEDTPLEAAVKRADEVLTRAGFGVGHREAHEDGSVEFAFSLTVRGADPEILSATLSHIFGEASKDLMRAHGIELGRLFGPRPAQQQRRASA